MFVVLGSRWESLGVVGSHWESLGAEGVNSPTKAPETEGATADLLGVGAGVRCDRLDGVDVRGRGGDGLDLGVVLRRSQKNG